MFQFVVETTLKKVDRFIEWKTEKFYSTEPAISPLPDGLVQ